MLKYSAKYNHNYSVQFIVDEKDDFNYLLNLPLKNSERVFVIFDEKVNDFWGKTIITKLNSYNKKVLIHSIVAEEKSKSLEGYLEFIKYLESNRASRFDMVVVVGGGIILDLVSFTLSTYMRGIKFIAIPTTIIGQMDASTAGKTCLNSYNNKNILGTFYYPLLVYNNVNILRTNTAYYSRQGFSEIFKYGLLRSLVLLEMLENYFESDKKNNLNEIIFEAVKVRCLIRQEDPLASNLGHTFGHALEKLSGYRLLHGDAISMGTVLALYFAVDQRVMKKDMADNIVKRMIKVGLNIYIDSSVDVKELINTMRFDKKSSLSSMNFVLIEKIGKPYRENGTPFYNVEHQIVENFLNRFLSNYEFVIKQSYEFLKTDKIKYR